MNANQLYVLESLIGPPSEKVDIQTFLGSTATFSQTYSQTNNFTQEIKDECSVSDIRDSLRDTWDDPSLSSYLTKYHDRTIQALDNAMNQKTSKANRKACVPESDATQAEFELQATLDSVSLKSFRLKADAAPFMRTARNSDKNILQSVKSTPASNSSDETEEAIITMSIYNKLTWTPSYVARSSQHVFLSSHTLQDVADIFPCTSKNLPPEAGLSEESSDSFVVCLEGTVYGSRSGEEGYAAKIFELATAKEGSSLSLSSSPLRDVPLRLFSLRINEPYWFTVFLPLCNAMHYLHIRNYYAVSSDYAIRLIQRRGIP
ncbi:hypothetical protein D9613_000410 [Agrocybe pediades]|uniref:Uncharacterized protein n=1 Tax=Agrocybe pediades TaxID=84607 RepID=A0A8H4R1B4_9AGAR|nr:hypothetical protein D9613_000410 [Agrocybe pediades]